MSQPKLTNLQKAVKAYIALGHARGFLKAEFFLMDYLPKSKPEGRVCDISPRRLPAFTKAALREAQS